MSSRDAWPNDNLAGNLLDVPQLASAKYGYVSWTGHEDEHTASSIHLQLELEQESGTAHRLGISYRRSQVREMHPSITHHLHTSSG